MDKPIPEAVREARQIIDEFIQCAEVGRPHGNLIAQARDWLAVTAAQQPDHIVDATKMVAQQQGQAVDCQHVHRHAEYDCVVCDDCGAIRTDGGKEWPVKNAWFASRDLAKQPMQQGGGDGLGEGGRYWRERAEFWRVQAVALGWREKRDAENGEAAPPSAPVGVEAAEAMGARGGPASESERLAFEAWMRGHCWALCATWDGTGYRSDAEQGGRYCPDAGRTRGLWAAWRDRAALAQQPAAVAVDAPWQQQLADALDSFWNPACGAIQEASYHGPASGSDVVGAIAQGLSAVAASLRESATQHQEPTT
jgi:hypothetical protein